MERHRAMFSPFASSFIFGIVLILGAVNVRSQTGGFRDVGLQMHNGYRARYDCAPLELSSELNKIAHKHAEYLADSYQFGSDTSSNGVKQNVWAHLAELRPISLDVRDAVTCWYTGTVLGSNTAYQVKPNTLYSQDVHYLGIGVGTSGNYTVVVANYM